MRFHQTGLSLLLLAASSGHVLLAASAPPPPELQACVHEQDDQLRLACFDNAMRRLASGPGENYGLSPEQVRKSTPVSSADKAATSTLSATVTAATARSDGRQVFRLSNGQVWVQVDAYDVAQIKSGDTVTIKPGVLGSYFLYTSSGWRTRVSRSK